jgi:5-hydroxyisourate hydrolase
MGNHAPPAEKMDRGMSRISTHVLDNVKGKPAAGVPVRLERQDASGKWSSLNSTQTDQDGRCGELLPDGATLAEGVYRLTFDTAKYFAACGVDGLYPAVEVLFRVRKSESHFHIPLLLSPNGYTTYRGS